MQNSSNRIGASLSGCFTLIFALLLLLVSVAFQPVQAAGGESYDYDGLGRLVRAISSSGVVTEYVYDAAGNITAVIRGAVAPPPTLTNVAPGSIRRGSQARVTLTGTNLQNAALQALDREMTISGVARTATSLTFDLAASNVAVLGASTLRVSSAAGSATVSINVRPALPTIELSPLPIAAPPDGRNATVDIVLSNADDQAHTIGLSTAQTNIATVSPASVLIPAGATRTTFFVSGRATGNTELRLESTTLGNSVYPVFILTDFVGINTARASPVGLYVTPPDIPTSGLSGVTAAMPVGVVWSGTTWLDSTPRFVSQGAVQSLRIGGSGLPSGLAVSVTPADGLSFSPVTVSGDGSFATVNVTAAANTVQGPRRLAVTAGAMQLTPIVAGADLLDVVAPLPQITSVQPLLLATSSAVPAFEIRGRHLQDVTAVSVLGGGVTVSNTFSVNPDGTLLTVALQVSPVAEPGARTVVVYAPGGGSSATPTAFNTVRVVEEGQGFESYPALLSPVVGLVLETDVPQPPPGTYTAPIPAPVIGVAVGSFAIDSTPATIARTETRTLRIRGQGLAGINAVSLFPATGLTVGQPTSATDGSEVTFQVSAAGDAPLGLRRIELSAGGQPASVMGTAPLTLQVTPLTPVLDSIQPNSVRAAGTAFTLTIRGRNFQGAAAVRLAPAADVTVGTPSVNADGTQIQVEVSIDPAAVRGQRLVTVIGPATESSSVSTASNTLNIVDGVALSDVPSVLVGVMVGEPPPPDPMPPATAVVGAPRVGVAVGAVQPDGLRNTVDAVPVGLFVDSVTSPTQMSLKGVAAPMGIVRGAAVLSVEPAALVPGQTAQLLVRGHAIPLGASIVLAPAGAATLAGVAVVDADGSGIRQSVTVNAGAPTSLNVMLLRADGTPIPAASIPPTIVAVVPGLPEVVSLEPILARQGDMVSLVIRGQRLGQAVRVGAEPAQGIEFASGFTVNGNGTELTVRFFVRDDAPLGARVIRVFNPLGGSAADASPANTFTVFAK